MTDQKHARSLGVHRNASSRILRRVASKRPWSLGDAFQRGKLGPFGIRTMRREALSLAGITSHPQAPRGEGRGNSGGHA